MRLAKSIDELYEEVRGYDLVLCNDAPLSLALNNRLDRPRVGAFAVTPRELAGGMALDFFQTEILSDIGLIKKVSENTGYRLRYVHGEIENIKGLRRFTSEIRNHLSMRSKKIYDEYIELPTLERIMGEFDGENAEVFKGKRIAVIGTELYDDLDKHFNPKIGTFDEISPFKKGNFSIGEIRELSNDRQIAENAVSLISWDNARDVAIVMDVKGPIANAVRSALYRKGLPFINALNVKDLNHVRDYLEFLRLSLSFDTIKVKNVRELISSYGGYIRNRYDEYLLQQYANISDDSDKTKRILDVMRDIRSLTFMDVCDTIVYPKDSAQIKVLLGEMDLKKTPVSEKDVNDIVYAVNNIGNLKHNEQIPMSEKEGVLLVDCQKSVYIDRPVVIFLGMGSEWEKDLSSLDSLKSGIREDENEKNVWRFQIMLQQGTSRIYICNSMKNGKKPRPCMFFDECSDTDGKAIRTFEDVCDTLTIGKWYQKDRSPIQEMGFTNIDRTEYVKKPFSKSSYNNFVSCPRKFMFDKMLNSEDKKETVSGNMIHEYAEFRLCYPELAKQHDADYFVDIISDVCTGLYAPEVRSMERSKMRNSIDNINRFVEVMDFDGKIKIDPERKKEKENVFFKLFGVSGGSDSTEVKYTSRDSHMEGIFDLLTGGVIYDYKTGRPSSVKKIASSMDLGRKEYKEFQCMFYISLLNEMVPSNKNEFDLFYTMDNDSKAVHGIEFDVRNNIRHVSLIEDKEYFLKAIFREEIVSTSTYSFLDSIWDIFSDAVMSAGIDDEDGLLSRNVEDRMISYVGNDNATNRKKISGAVNKIKKAISGREIFRVDGKNTLYITKKALEDFRTAVSKAFSDAENYYDSGFPATPTIKCSDCSFADVCTAEPSGGEDDVDESE